MRLEMTLKTINLQTFGYSFAVLNQQFGRLNCMRIVGEKQILTQKNKQNGIEWSVLIWFVRCSF
jgi:hypothetical protein